MRTGPHHVFRNEGGKRRILFVLIANTAKKNAAAYAVEWLVLQETFLKLKIRGS
jgi:hypothetical protein